MYKLLKGRFLSQIIVPIIFSFSLLLVGYLIVNPVVKKLLINERRQMVQEMVKSACNLLEGYNEHVKHGDFTLIDAKLMAIDNIRQLRYGKNGSNYFWIQDYNGQLIYHPYLELETPVNTKISSSIQGVAKQISQFIKTKNEGFISYQWYSPTEDSEGNLKESYAKGNKQWDWIVCTGFMTTDIEEDLHNLSQKAMGTLFAFLGGMLVILSIVLFRNYRNLKKLMQTDIELKRSEARFRGFVGHIESGLMIFENGKPVFANEKFGEIFHSSPEEVLYFQLEEYLPSWEKERVRIFQATTPLRKDIEFDTWLLLKDQTEKYVNLHFSYDIETHINSTYLVVHDITHQKHTQNTIDILSENLTKIPDSIVITDLIGNIEYVNPGFEKASGYSFQEVKGKNPRILNSGKMSPLIFEDLWRTISIGEIWQGEMLNKKKDGSLYWESTIVFPVKNSQNEIIKYSSIKTDITNTKRIEKELLAAKDKAEESDRLKSAFLDNVSHEVRTPLNAIYGFTQILEQNLEKDEDSIRYLKIMEKNCQILLGLFDDIIDVSSIESKSVKLSKEDISVKELLMKIVSKYNTKLAVSELKPIEIIIEKDVNFETMVMYSDRERISQVFDKLLSNAIKFTKEGHIKISYTISYDYLTFHITDTGVGIPDTESEMIFDSFSHGTNLYVSLHKGVGLGLNIAKQLIEMMGGTISFSSQEGRGTTFSFTFPTIDLKNYMLNGNHVGSYVHNLNGKNILIAEDNDENFKYLEILLSPQNNILRAKTGTEAIIMVEKGEILPDFILMDILMPEMDGITASRLIRKIKPRLPIIAITAIGSEISGVDKKLFDDVINKPVTSQQLMSKIQEFTGN